MVHHNSQETIHDKNESSSNTVNTNSPYLIWLDTLLSKFGLKCITNKHKPCIDLKCECHGHQVILEVKDK